MVVITLRYTSIVLYDKGLRYKGGHIPMGHIYVFKAYKPRSNRRPRLGKGIYTRQEYRCSVYASNEYEAYILMLDYGYEDIVIIND